MPAFSSSISTSCPPCTAGTCPWKLCQQQASTAASTLYSKGDSSSSSGRIHGVTLELVVGLSVCSVPAVQRAVGRVYLSLAAVPKLAAESWSH